MVDEKYNDYVQRFELAKARNDGGLPVRLCFVCYLLALEGKGVIPGIIWAAVSECIGLDALTALSLSLS